MIDVTNSEWIDRHGGLKSHRMANDSDGEYVLFNVIGGLLGVLPASHVDRTVQSCIDPETGCLRRRPDNGGSGGPQQHDGWMALAVWMLYMRNAVVARGLLVSALFRGFYMKTKPLELEGKTLWQRLEEIGKPWLIRYPRVWLVVLVAAHPPLFVRWPCSQLIRWMTSTSTGPISDASGLQNRFLDLYAVGLMTNWSSMRSFLLEAKSKGGSFADLMSNPADPYWDVGHPMIEAYRHFEQELLGS